MTIIGTMGGTLRVGIPTPTLVSGGTEEVFTTRVQLQVEGSLGGSWYFLTKYITVFLTVLVSILGHLRAL